MTHISLPDYTADEPGSYGPAFHMAGGASGVLYCVKIRDTKVRESLKMLKNLKNRGAMIKFVYGWT